MAKIDLLDTSMRDGNQSLWGAVGLNTAMMLQIAPTIDRVGFSAIDFTSSTHMAVAVRFMKENPWERIRLMRAAMPQTPLSFLTTGMRFISWEVASPELMQLAFTLLCEAGIRRFVVADPMNDAAAMTTVAGIARKIGAPIIVGGVTYTVSPLHTDALFAGIASKLAACADIDIIYLKDPGGLLTPERARTLVPLLRKAVGKKTLEVHSHCTIGLAPFSYLESAAGGANVLHTAVRPLANGSSQPAAEQTIANLRDLGHSVDIDDAALAKMSSYFAALAKAEGYQTGVPQEHNRAYFRHQMPGGMLGTFKRQLGEMKRADLLDQVLEEVEHVRAHMGYPIMVTPFSQIVGTQAVMNVISGERYSRLPDEVIRYALGRFGAPAAPLDGNLLDRVHSSARGKELKNEPDMPPLNELRRRFAANISDEEFLLRAVMPAEQVDAMVAAGAAKLGYNPEMRPTLKLIEELTKRNSYHNITIEKSGLRLELKKHKGAASS